MAKGSQMLALSRDKLNLCLWTQSKSNWITWKGATKNNWILCSPFRVLYLLHKVYVSYRVQASLQVILNVIANKWRSKSSVDVIFDVSINMALQSTHLIIIYHYISSLSFIIFVYLHLIATASLPCAERERDV